VATATGAVGVLAEGRDADSELAAKLASAPRLSAGLANEGVEGSIA
jgi:hypothetical protein